MAQAGEVEVTVGGDIYRGAWRLEGETIHLSSSLGSTTAKVVGATPHEIQARIMLRGVVVETGGYPAKA